MVYTGIAIIIGGAVAAIFTFRVTDTCRWGVLFAGVPAEVGIAQACTVCAYTGMVNAFHAVVVAGTVAASTSLVADEVCMYIDTAIIPSPFIYTITFTVLSEKRVFHSLITHVWVTWTAANAFFITYCSERIHYFASTCLVTPPIVTYALAMLVMYCMVNTEIAIKVCWTITAITARMAISNVSTTICACP